MGRTTTERMQMPSGLFVVTIAVVSGLASLSAGLSPTESRLADLIVVAIAVGVATWVGSSGPRLLVFALLALVAVSTLSPVVIGLGIVAIGAAEFARARGVHNEILVAGLTAATLNLAAWSRLDNFFGLSALIGVTAGIVLFVAGVFLLDKVPRRIVMTAVFGLGIVAAVACGAIALAMADTNNELSAANRQLTIGSAQLRRGDTVNAQQSFANAAQLFVDVEDRVATPLGVPAAVIPIVAQHRRTIIEVSREAATLTADLSNAAAGVDLGAITARPGNLDGAMIRSFEAPLANARDQLRQIRSTIAEVRSPWLVDLIRDELDELDVELTVEERRAEGALDVVQTLPAILGTDEPRRYLIAVTNPNQASTLGGTVESWFELTLDAGALTVGSLDQSARGALADVDAGVPMSRFGPQVASSVEAVDGVIALDVFTLGRLLKFSGQIVVDDRQIVRESNAADILLYERYGTPSVDDAVQKTAVATFDLLRTSPFPDPQRFVDIMGSLAREGRLQAWATRLDEQQFLEQINMAGQLTPNTVDHLTFSLDNQLDNAVDYFLTASAQYDVAIDASTGTASATLEIHLDNAAPATGEAAELIDNDAGLTPGTNRTRLTVVSALPVVGAQLDGIDSTFTRTNGSPTDDGEISTAFDIEMAPASNSVLSLTLSGPIDLSAGYGLTVVSPPTVSRSPIAANVVVVKDSDSVERSIESEIGAATLLINVGTR